MINNRYDNLQYIFACISTHSRWVEIIENDFNKISEYFNLYIDDKNALRNFFNMHSQKIWVSATISEEKRWREILPSIKYTSNFVGLRKLKLYWQHYLNSFSLKDNIPESPIIESEKFITYLSKKSFIPIIKNIFEYERLRNSVFNYKFEFMSDRYEESFAIIKENLIAFKAEINPSMVAKKFDFSISKIIASLDKGFYEANSDSEEAEQIIFYKKINTSIVKSSKINEVSNSCLLKLRSSENVACWVSEITNLNNFSQKSCLVFLEEMHKNGIIYFIKIK